jgi:hypothetical protein
MTTIASAVGRLYRLGLCASLIIIDGVLLSVFAYDLYRFAQEGYGFEVLRTFPSGSNLLHAAADALTTCILLLLALPLVVATIRVFLTRLRLPNVAISPLRLFVCHILLSLLLCLCVMAGYKMQVASGDKYNSTTSTVEGFEYSANVDLVPSDAEKAVEGSPSYVLQHKAHYGFRVLIFVFLLLTGREVFKAERKFVADYVNASRLVDVDPNFLPKSTAATRVTGLRPCAPVSEAMESAIEKAMEAFDKGGTGEYDLDSLASRARSALNRYLFGGSLEEGRIRLMPNALSCVFTALANESPKSRILLSPLNHAGMNEFVKTWFIDRDVVVLDLHKQELEAWKDQQEVLIEEVRRQKGACDNPILILPLVSKYTGQVLEVEELVTRIRSCAAGAVIILDASFLNVQLGTSAKHCQYTDYLCLNVSQWLGCSETCGVLVAMKDLPAERAWEHQISFAPENIRTISAFATALDHSFKECIYFNNPQSRFDILYEKFGQELEGWKIRILRLPDLQHFSYFLTVQPTVGKEWNPNLQPELAKRGLPSGLTDLDGVTRLTIAIPPYTDYWQMSQFAEFLNQSVS